MGPEGREDGVRYEGSYCVVTGTEAERDDVEAATRCGVCGGGPAPWRHSTETPARAALASASSWHLCEECHRLVLERRERELSERFERDDLALEERLELARRLR